MNINLNPESSRLSIQLHDGDEILGNPINIEDLEVRVSYLGERYITNKKDDNHSELMSISDFTELVKRAENKLENSQTNKFNIIKLKQKAVEFNNNSDIDSFNLLTKCLYYFRSSVGNLFNDKNKNIQEFEESLQQYKESLQPEESLIESHPETEAKRQSEIQQQEKGVDYQDLGTIETSSIDMTQTVSTEVQNQPHQMLTNIVQQPEIQPQRDPLKDLKISLKNVKDQTQSLDETIEKLESNVLVRRLEGVMIMAYFRNSIENKIAREEFDNLKNLENQEKKDLAEYLEKLVKFIELTKSSQEGFVDFDPDRELANLMLESFMEPHSDTEAK